MGSNRIQKLLFSEYSDLEDTVLIESPFAETNREGRGIRQVQIGLTPTKLILAEYCVKALEAESGKSGADPEIDSFELVCAYPVDCVNLSIFHHRKRKSIKASFSNGNVHYYEIGGWQERKMLWSVWCDRIKFLSPYETSSSVSETSIASSSSGLYISRSNFFPTASGKTLLWCHYSSTTQLPPEQSNFQSSWSDPHLYLGPSFLNRGVNFRTLPVIESKSLTFSTASDAKKCKASFPMMLSAEHEVIARQAVELWESQSSPFRKHLPRLYALSPCPGLLSGLGLWRVSRAEAYSIQRKRSASLVMLRERRVEGLRTRLSPSQLVRTVSLEMIDVPALSPDNLMSLVTSSHRPVKPLNFWTRGEGCGLEGKKNEYKKQQKHLRLLRKRSSTTVVLWQREVKKTKPKPRSKSTITTDVSRISRQESNEGKHVHEGGGDSCTNHLKPTIDKEKPPLGCIKKFSSTKLAHQLILIDKHLFLQLSTLELGRVRKDKSSWRTPHLRELLSFSHRVSSLVASQVLSEIGVKERSICIVKCIEVAYKCHKFRSLQSAVSVLRGLQCPPVYRLHRTWKYVRRNYACKFRRFEDLSKRYQDPRLPLYQRTLDTHTRTPPYLPCVELLVAGLLRRVSNMPSVTSAKFSSESCKSDVASVSDPPLNPVKKFLSIFNMYSPTPSEHVDNESSDTSLDQDSIYSELKLEDLDQCFAPVAEDSPNLRLLQDLDYFLEASQAAAQRYVVTPHQRIRELFLRTPYEPLPQLFTSSLQLEPNSEK